MRASRRPTYAGPDGCCCQLGVLTCSGPERLINKLSLIFCSIRNDGVQLDLMRRCCWFVVLVMITLDGSPVSDY